MSTWRAAWAAATAGGVKHAAKTMKALRNLMKSLPTGGLLRPYVHDRRPSPPTLPNSRAPERHFALMSLAAKHGVPKLGLRRPGAVLRVVGQHLWPKGETGLRCRVVVAMVLLIVAKVTNVYVPVLYKHAVDALGEPAAQAVAVPVALILAYGVARVLAQAFGELRDAIFAPVSQRAIRNI